LYEITPNPTTRKRTDLYQLKGSRVYLGVRQKTDWADFKGLNGPVAGDTAEQYLSKVYAGMSADQPPMGSLVFKGSVDW